MNRYRRVLLKLSGAAIAGDDQVGFDRVRLERIADEIRHLIDDGLEAAVVFVLARISELKSVTLHLNSMIRL